MAAERDGCIVIIYKLLLRVRAIQSSYSIELSTNTEHSDPVQAS